MSASLLEVSGLSVRLGAEQNLVVDGVGFELGTGERMAILGPSGCGKTTTLRAIAGFEQAAAGTVALEGRPMSRLGSHVPPHLRSMGMVFQDFALFPHLTVAENVAFGLRGSTRAGRTRVVEELLGRVDLEGFGERMPGQLSGGQQQRVALARALAPNPRLMLLDEPFSSLDAGLRAATRLHTEQVLASVGAAALLVTHDQDEAMAFAQRLVLMRAGKVEQIGTPESLYRAPRSVFVARFLGTANLIQGEASGDTARTPLGQVALQSPAQGRVLLCLRPETLGLSASGAAQVRISQREYRGSTVRYIVQGSGFECSVLAPGDSPWKVGDAAALTVNAPAAVVEDSSA